MFGVIVVWRCKCTLPSLQDQKGHVHCGRRRATAITLAQCGSNRCNSDALGNENLVGLVMSGIPELRTYSLC